MAKKARKKSGKKMNGFLAAWLALIALGNFAAALIHLFEGEIVELVAGVFPIWIIYAFGAISTLNIVFVVYLFMWKKWAFTGLLATSIITFAINLLIGVGVGASLYGLLGIVVLYFALKPQWALLE
jgi:hypothetical protein